MITDHEYLDHLYVDTLAYIKESDNFEMDSSPASETSKKEIDNSGFEDDSNDDFNDGDKEESAVNTSSDIGRAYTLKQLYYKLLALNNILEKYNDKELYKFKNTIRKSLELFQIVSGNIEKYRDKIDIIITDYYHFVEKASSQFKIYLEKK